MVISPVFTSERGIGALSLILLAVLAYGVANAADKIRVGYSGVTVSNAMLWVTDEGRLFQKNGIDPQILYLRTTLGQTAMIAGEVDMCVYSGSLFSSARLQGADVVMVTSFLDKPLYRLVVRPEIRTVADLNLNCLQIRQGGVREKQSSNLGHSRGAGVVVEGKVILPEVNINHIGFQVDDLAATNRKLASLKPAITPVASPPDGRYEDQRFLDPEVNDIELSQRVWDPGPEKKSAAARHVAFGRCGPRSAGGVLPICARHEACRKVRSQRHRHDCSLPFGWNDE